MNEPVQPQDDSYRQRVPITRTAVRAVSGAIGFVPRRQHGQNFLVDAAMRDAILRSALMHDPTASAADATAPVDDATAPVDAHASLYAAPPPAADDAVVLEVGPGLGALTGAMLDLGLRVIAVELDDRLAGFLQRTLGDHPRFTLINADVLERKNRLRRDRRDRRDSAIDSETGDDPSQPASGATADDATGEPANDATGELANDATGHVTLAPSVLQALDAAARAGRADGAPLRMIANLPYSIASPLLVALAELSMSRLPNLCSAVVMVQSEVADRMRAAPGSREFGLLSVLLQAHGTARPLRRVPPEVYTPRPKVDSTLLRIDFTQPHRAALGDATRYRAFVELAKAIYQARRKRLPRAIVQAHLAPDIASAEAAIKRAGLSVDVRGETLGVGQLIALRDALGDAVGDAS